LLIDLLALTIVMAFLLLSIMHVVRGRYKSALSLILANLALILAFVLPSNGERNFGYARDAADYIKFSLHEKQYLEAIKLTQKNDGGLRYKEFIWSFRFGGEGSRLVYDESDELGLPNDRRSQAWWTNLNNHSRRYFEDCIKGLYKIKPHYYVVRLTCG